MYEVEMKYRLGDPAAFEKRVFDLFAVRFGEERTEEDLYFQRVSLDFRETGEALRIRRIGEELAVTYKGPRRDPVVKTREEIELPLRFAGEAVPPAARREAWIRLLTRLGYEPFAEIAKTRRSAVFQCGGRRFTLTRESLPRLGEFTEIETLVGHPREIPAAQADLKAAAARLGLTDTVFASYLTLLLESRGEVFPGSD